MDEDGDREPDGGSSSSDPEIDPVVDPIYNGELIYEEIRSASTENLIPNTSTNINDYDYTEFTITNNSDNKIFYNLVWIISKNTFRNDSKNFQYVIISNNGGYSMKKTNWTVVPSVSENGKVIKKGIAIPAHTTQTYKIYYRLKETGSNQNYDMGKDFSGYVKVKAN